VGVDETSEEEQELGEIRFGLVCTADLWPPNMSGRQADTGGSLLGLTYSLAA